MKRGSAIIIVKNCTKEKLDLIVFLFYATGQPACISATYSDKAGTKMKW